MEGWAPNPDFGHNHAFAVREQLHRFRTKPTPDLDSPWSKVPPAIWNVVFYRMSATPFRYKNGSRCSLENFETIHYLFAAHYL